jgi:hypothetical protein
MTARLHGRRFNHRVDASTENVDASARQQQPTSMRPPAHFRRLLSVLCAAMIAGCATTPAPLDPTPVPAPVSAGPAPTAISAPPAEAVADAEHAAAAAATPLDAQAPKPVDPLRPEVIVDLNDAAAQAGSSGTRRGRTTCSA